jgi:PAS domain S-box-containing protein
VPKQGEVGAGGSVPVELAAVLDALNDPVAIKSTQGIYLHVNPAFVDMTGLDPDEVLGLDARAVYEPWLASRIREAEMQAAQGVRVRFDISLDRGHSAGERHYELVVSPLRDEQGRLSGIVSISRDVTERRRMIDELSRVRDNLTSLIDYTEDAIVFCDAAGRAVEFNAAFAALVLDASGRAMATGVDPAVRLPDREEGFWTAHRDAVLEGQRLVSEWSYGQEPDEIVHEVSFVPLQRGESVAGFTMTFHDVTESRRTARELRKSRNMLDNVVSAVPDMMYMMDAEHTIIWANEALIELAGRDPAGEKCHFVFKRRASPCEDCQPILTLRDGVMRNYESTVQAADGRSVTVWGTSGVAERDERGRPRLIVEILRDVTERKRHLEELREAKEAAEKANYAKSLFLANMSHELRTPLNGVLGMLQVVGQSPLDPQQREQIEAAHASGRKLLNMINNVLDLTRLESGDLDIRKGEVNLRRMADAVIQEFEEERAAKGLLMTSRVHAGVPEVVVADPESLRRILSVLVGNAVKFTEQGTVSLEMSPAEPPEDDQGRARLLITVADSGVGIPEDKQEHIFSVFSQADEGFTRRFGGSGLGLGIVKRLVDLMGGRIWVESEPGKGATFYLSFDFHVATGRRSPQPRRTPGAERSGGLRLLLAEDNALNRMYAEKLLAKMGHEVVCVENGEKVLETLSRERFDVVLLDVSMPVLDGVATTEIIRGGGVEGIDPATTIIALTAYGTASDRERFAQAGMDGYVAKPIDPAELREALANHAGPA